MTDHQAVNEKTSSLIKAVGREVGTMSAFAPKMVVIEGLAAGLIGLLAAQHNRHPDELVDAFCDGLRSRVTAMIYGKKQ